MTITIVFFDSGSEFIKHVEQSIVETKTLLGVQMNQIEETRKRYDKEKKRNDTLKRLAGGKREILQDTKQLEMAGFKVLVNPSPEYELTLMEDAINSLQEKLDAFERTKQIFPQLGEDNLRIGMVQSEGVPTGFMMYIK